MGSTGLRSPRHAPSQGSTAAHTHLPIGGARPAPPGRSSTVALVRFEDALQEIFAVQLLPGRWRPDVLNDDTVRLADSFVVPDDALAEVAEPFRKFATPRAAG